MIPVVKLQVQRAPGDCGICALSMLLGVPYEDVLGAAVKTTGGSRVHHNGMQTRDMRRAAKKLGIHLTLRRAVDLEQDEGVLSLEAGEHCHAVLLKAGLIFDGDGTVWEPETYLLSTGYRVLSLLVRSEDA
jgi:hypothetical protein